jgi:hypothetical protein
MYSDTQGVSPRSDRHPRCGWRNESFSAGHGRVAPEDSRSRDRRQSHSSPALMSVCLLIRVDLRPETRACRRGPATPKRAVRTNRKRGLIRRFAAFTDRVRVRVSGGPNVAEYEPRFPSSWLIRGSRGGSIPRHADKIMSAPPCRVTRSNFNAEQTCHRRSGQDPSRQRERPSRLRALSARSGCRRLQWTRLHRSGQIVQGRTA